MRRIAVVTDFYEPDFAYSLVGVASNQIKMLLRAGYDPLVMVDEFFPDSGNPYPWDSVRRFKLPSIPRSNRVELPEDWQSHLERMTNAMREGLKDIDIVLSHDLIYQPSMITYQMAARKITAERPNSLFWCHLLHSATTPELLNTTNEYLQIVRTKFPQSVIVFPNEYSRPRLAANFGYEEHEIKYAPHAIDFCDYFGFHPMATKIVEEYNMLGADVIMCYPARLDRGKQNQWLLYIAAALKRLGRSVRVIFPAFHSTGNDKVVYKKWLYDEAHRVGLSDEEFVFTCDFDESLHVRCPQEMIRNFFTLSNVFVLPSRSESFSLIALEAGLCANLMVLNFDFSPLRFWGDENIWAKFSSNIDNMTGLNGDTTVSYKPSEQAYAHDLALRILHGLQHNVGLRMKTKLRQQYNLMTVFRKYWEPLLYGWDFEAQPIPQVVAKVADSR